MISGRTSKVSKQCVHDQFLVVNVVNTLICYEMLLKMTLNLYIYYHPFCVLSGQKKTKFLTAGNAAFGGTKIFCCFPQMF